MAKAVVETLPLFELARPELRPVTMNDVRAAEKTNGLNVVSTFTGAGGSTTGYRLAGFHVVYANEFVEAASETYKANYPETPLDLRDVREVSGADLLAAVWEAGYREIDVLEGSPPCSAFSMSGQRDKAWGKTKTYSDTEQRVDDLFYEWIRLVGETRPKIAVAENVVGLALGKAVSYLDEIVRRLRGHGYRVDVRELNAADYDVPQARHRLFIQAVRNDLGIAPAWPERNWAYRYTVEDVLACVEAAGGNDPEELAYASMEKYAVGDEWKRLAEGEISTKYQSLVRANRSKPCNTLTATAASTGAASVAHPYECRKFTVRECRLLSTFPEDFKLTGTFEKQIERLGRAVPPLLAKAVATAIASALAPVNREELW